MNKRVVNEEIDIEAMHKNPPYSMIIILFIGGFVALLNNTLLNIALPTIMEEFSVGPSTVQWLTTGYMLVNGVMIPASAFFITKITNRRLFIAAMFLFSTGTALAIVSPTFVILVVARMIQASGAAIMMPLLMNVMLTAFPVERRGTAMGFFGLVMFTAPAVGPTLSGWIVENYSWRLLFGLVLPFAIMTLIYGVFKLRNITPNRDVDLDVISMVLSALGFGGLLYGFSTAGEAINGWGSLDVVITLSVGSLSLLIFIIRQIKMKEPMLDFKIYKYSMFALASIISIVISVALFSGMLLTPLYVQTVRDISPVQSGLLMLPGAIIMGIMSPITGRLFDKYGPRTLAITGLTITTVMTFFLSRLDLDISYGNLMLIYTIRMFGLSMVSMPIMTNGLNQLPMPSYPHGTAINNTLQQVSGAIGSAFLLTIMTKRTEHTALQVTQTYESTDQMTSFQIQQEIEKIALLDGINFSFFISTILIVIALILTFFVKRVKSPSKELKAT